MKIAHLTCVYPPYRGGIGTVAYDEARLLHSRGYKIVVFTPNYNAHVTKEKNKQGFEVNYLKPLLSFGNAALLPQLMWNLRKYDNVYLHFPFLGAGIFVWLLKKIRGKKMNLVVRYHMDFVGHGLKGLIFAIYTRYLMPKILKSADKIIVSSFDYVQNSNTKDIYEKNQERFVEIPFGVDTGFFFEGPRSKELLQRHFLKEADKIILFAGGLDSAHYFKGLEYLLLAMKKVQIKHNVKLIVIGQKGNLEDYYKKKVHDLEIEKSVIFAGTVSENDLPKYYRLCDLFCLPSTDKSEAFGIVFLEASASGKPVIGSNLAGVRIAIQDKKDGYLIEPKDVKDLAEKIIYLIENPDVSEKFGRSGREKVLNKYTYDKIADSLEKIYNN